MAALKKLIDINLLPQEEFESSTRGRVLRWLLTTFRYLVIVTEMVVIAAFLSRFYFDSRLNDLNDEITQKSAYIASFADFEKTFRQTQTKLSILSSMTTQDKIVSPIFSDIVSRLPDDVSLDNLSVTTANKIVIVAQSLSDRSIQQFLVNLSDSPYLEKVGLAQSETKQDVAQITFTIQAQIRGSTK